LPVRVLSRVFRGKFVAGLQRAFAGNQLAFHGECRPLANKTAFAAFLRALFRQEWVVYSKAPFGGPEHVLQYLARYTHRVAISNHRLLSVDDKQVTFRWKDYAHHGRNRVMTLSLEEFLRRFLQHVLPKSFPRIRYCGWLANRRRREMLPLCRTLLSAMPPPAVSPTSTDTVEWQCPACGGAMRVIQRLTASEILREQSRRVCLIDSS
jgi:Putative transposase